MENNENEKSLQKVNKTGSFNLDVINDKEATMEFFTTLVKNKQIGINTPEEALTLYLKANELGVGFASALDHMHVINGKTGIDIHILKAILLKAGRYIRWTKTKDYLPQYQYTDNSSLWVSHLKPKAFLKWLAEEDPYYDNAMYVATKAHMEECKSKSMIPIRVNNTTGKLEPFDYITEYKFEREFKFGDAQKVEIRTEISSFTTSEALQSGKYQPNDPKMATSPWVAFTKLMLDHRAFTIGARAIGNDLVMGCYERKELYEMNGIDYIMDSEGNVIQSNIDHFKEIVKEPKEPKGNIEDTEVIDETEYVNTSKQTDSKKAE